MTSIAPPAVGVPGPEAATERSPLTRLWGGRAGEITWLPAFIAVGLLAVIVYAWDLTISGYANTYYSAAAQAAALDWKAWFFGSLDPANWITLDKPPLATMVMGLSVRLFGLSPLSVLLPQALMGVATVLLLFHVVRRSFGTVAATIAGIVMALTPVAVLIFRYNNPDALLTLLFVIAAWMAMRAIESGRLRWVLATAVLIGLAFNTKYLQAYLVVPAFALTWLLFAVGSLRHRLWGLVMAGVGLVVASSWWVAVVELMPVADRPYVGGSQANSALELVFGYDGLQRIFGFFGGRGGPPGGGPGPGGGGGGPGAGFSGDPGLLRLLNDQIGGQIAWLLPLAVVGLIAGLWLRRRVARTDGPRAAYVMWGLWLATHVVVFSFMSGIIHSYYTVAMAPAVAALAGAGLVDLWALRQRTSWGGALLGATLVATGLVGAVLLARTPDFAPWIAPVVVLVTLVVGAALALPDILHGWPRLAAALVAVGVAALLLGPAAYALDTMGTAYAGGDPSAGPDGSGFGQGGPGGVIVAAPGGAGGGLPVVGGGFGGPNGGADAGLADYLVANRGSADWIVAISSANEAGPLQISTGLPVLAMGGFSGSDPAMTVDRLRELVSTGRLRFVMTGGGPGGFGGGGGPGGFAPGGFGRSGSDLSSWISTSCAPVNQFSGLYDCSTP